MTSSTGSSGLAAAALLALLVAAAAPPPLVRARQLRQEACADLVPGAAWEAVVEARPAPSNAADATPVANVLGAGPIYLVGVAEDASSPEGASQFDLQLWDATSNNQLAAALASASGCATTPVVDPCQQSGGPADVQVRVRCANPPGRPCRVRVAAYASACPDGPPPQVAVVTDGGGGSSGGVGGGSTAAVDSSRPDQMTAQPPSSSSAVTSDGSSSGVSPTVWVVAGVSVGAALLIALLIWLYCRCRRRRRPAADLEAGTLKPPGKQQQQQQQQQQQFLVSSSGGPGLAVPPLPPRQQVHAAPASAASPPPPAGANAPHVAAGVADGWAFAYKVPAQRLTFATDASRRSAVPQRWERIDDWLAAIVSGGGGGVGGPGPATGRWEGCLLYNDDPPATFPDGSPTGYSGPAPYKPCGHAKGVVLWSASVVGWLVHSVPCWPCHDRSARSGVGPRLSPVQDPQTDRGQSFMFVALPRAALPAVLQQLLHMQVLAYFTSDPSVWPHQPRDYTRARGRGFRTLQLGPGLWHLAKANEPQANFYQHLSEGWGWQRWWLRTNLVVKDKARNQVPSTSLLLNVSTLEVPGFDHRPYQAGSEHAKLAVCVGRRDGDQPGLACVGDLNNTYPQWRRGGGGLVLHHPLLWQLLRLMAVDVGEP